MGNSTKQPYAKQAIIHEEGIQYEKRISDCV